MLGDLISTTTCGCTRVAIINTTTSRAIATRVVGSIGCVDFTKPMIMPDGSTFKDVGGRANAVAVVYVSDLIGQLMPSQVAEYAIHIGHVSTLTLQLRLDAPNRGNANGDLGTTPNPNLLMIEGTHLSTASDDVDTMTIPNRGGRRHSTPDGRITYSLHADRNGPSRSHTRIRRRATMSESRWLHNGT